MLPRKGKRAGLPARPGLQVLRKRLLRKPPAGPGPRRRERRGAARRGAAWAAAVSSLWRCERSCWPITTCMSSCGQGSRAGGVSVLAQAPPRPAGPAPHLPGLQLLRQRHLLADSAKQLPGERVPLQRDAAELSGQFQGPASKRGSEQIRGRRGLSEQGRWARAGVVPLTPKTVSRRAPGGCGNNSTTAGGGGGGPKAQGAL